MVARPPKPPIRLKYQVAADGKHPYYYADRRAEDEDGNNSHWAKGYYNFDRTEQGCVTHYVTRVLHPQEDCFVFIQEFDTSQPGIPKQHDIWTTYKVVVSGEWPNYIYSITKCEQQNAHATDS